MAESSMKPILIAALLSVVFLTACGATPSVMETEVPQAVESVTPRPTRTPYPVPTARPTSLQTNFSELTLTAQPSITPFPLSEKSNDWRLQNPFTDPIVFTNLSLNQSRQFSYKKFWLMYE
jgi:hypothetical protein